MLETLPSRPLVPAEITRLRESESVTAFTELEPRAHVTRNGGLKRAVALVEGRVVALAFEDGSWQRTVLAREADQRRHLEEALAVVGDA